MSSAAAKLDAAARQRRSAARKKLRAEGYRLLDDVPIHKDGVMILIRAGLAPAEAENDDRQLIYALAALLELVAHPLLAIELAELLERLQAGERLTL